MAEETRRRTIVIVTGLGLALLAGVIALSLVLRTPASKARTVKVDPTKQKDDAPQPSLVMMKPGNSGTPTASEKELEVRVRDSRGGAVGGAEIWVVKDNPYYPRMRVGQPVRAALVKTEASGAVKFKFPAGPANLLVTRSGLAPLVLRKVALDKKQPFDVAMLDGRTIRGTLQGADGKPLANVKVIARRQDSELSRMDALDPKATTDGAGNFAMPATAAGQYSIITQIETGPEGLFTTPVQTTVTPDSEAAALQLVAQAGSVIKGKYVSADGVKVSERPIYAYLRLPRSSGWDAATDADGRFIIKGIPAGATGQLQFYDSEHEFVRVKDPTKRFETTQRELRFKSLALGVYDGIEVRLGKTGVVSGLMKDEAGKPVKEAYVIVNDYRSFQTDAQGLYRADVPTGEPIVLSLSSSDGSVENHKTEPFTVEVGKPVTRDFVVKKRVIEPSTGAVTGQVVDESGQPVAKARVELGNEALLGQEALNSRNGGPKKPSWQGGTFWPARVVADGEGKFKFDQLYVGESDLWAEDDKNRAGWVKSIKSRANDVKIVLRKREENLRIEGRVVDENGKPVRGKARLLTNENNTPEKLAEAAVSEDGKVVFDVKMPVTNWQFLRFVFLSDNGRFAWRTLPECSGSFEIQLQPEAKITGIVKDSRGKAIGGADVCAYLGKHRSFGELIFYDADLKEMLPVVKTDAQGRFTLGGQPLGGTMSVIARAEGYEYNQAWHLEVKEATKDAGTITLQDAVSLDGVVRYEDGKPAAGAVVKLGWGSDEKQATAGADGAYRFASLHHNSFSNQYTQLTARLADSSDWEGSTRFEGQLSSGDHGTGADIVLKRSMQWRQGQWMQSPTTAPASAYLMAVVNDADKTFSGKEKFEDVVALVDGAGAARWKTSGLNVNVWFQPHGVLYHPLDKSIWVAGADLTKLKLDGTVEWTRKTVKANALALDPKTNNVWILNQPGNIYGDKLLIYNTSGEKVKEQKTPGFELAYSAHDDCFWVIGQTMRKLSRDGKVILESPTRFQWLASSLAVNESDGSVWVVEQEHPQVEGSKERVFIFEPDGKVRKTIEISGWHVALDLPRGNVWLSGTPDGLAQMTLEGEIVRKIPVTSSAIAIEPETGCVRLFGTGGSWRIDAKGNYVAGKTPSPWPKPGVGIASWVTAVSP